MQYISLLPKYIKWISRGVLSEVCTNENVGHLKVELLLLKNHFTSLFMFYLTMLLKTHLTLCKWISLNNEVEKMWVDMDTD